MVYYCVILPDFYPDSNKVCMTVFENFEIGYDEQQLPQIIFWRSTIILNYGRSIGQCHCLLFQTILLIINLF